MTKTFSPSILFATALFSPRFKLTMRIVVGIAASFVDANVVVEEADTVDESAVVPPPPPPLEVEAVEVDVTPPLLFNVLLATREPQKFTLPLPVNWLFLLQF